MPLSKNRFEPSNFTPITMKCELSVICVLKNHGYMGKHKKTHKMGDYDQGSKLKIKRISNWSPGIQIPS